MFFTKAATVLAWIIFLSCAATYAVITFATIAGQLRQLEDAMGRGFVASGGEAFYGMLIGVALGLAAEISRSIAGKA